MSSVRQNLGNAITPVIVGTAITIGGGSYGIVWPIAFIIVMITGLVPTPLVRCGRIFAAAFARQYSRPGEKATVAIASPGSVNLGEAFPCPSLWSRGASIGWCQ